MPVHAILFYRWTWQNRTRIGFTNFLRFAQPEVFSGPSVIANLFGRELQSAFIGPVTPGSICRRI
jgi:hypothetical protein